MKKRSFTLLELSIALVLMGILGGFLLQSHLHTTKAVKKLEKKKVDLLSRQRLYFHMSHIFSNLDSYAIKETSQLVLRHAGELDTEEIFRGPLTSLLFRDKNRLFLYTWPETGEARKMVLADEVTQFTVEALPEENPLAVLIKVNGIEHYFLL